MKHFLRRLALFLFLLASACAVLVIGTVLLHRRALPNCRLEQNTDAILVGDSHPMWAIDDSQIPGLRNISLNAEGYKYTYLKLRHLLQGEHAIKRIYIGAGYHNFSGYYDAYIDGAMFHQFVERYLSLLTLDDYLGLVRSAPRDVLGLAQRIVQRGFKPGLKRECLLYGRFPEEKKTATFDARHVQTRIREQFYAEGEVLPASASNLEYLQKLVELSRAHGLAITLLATPVHSEYERRVPESYRRMLRSFAQQHGLTLHMFEDLTLTDEHVLPDGDHTNYAGAMLTTRSFKHYHERH
jgi:hypothetical protein